MVTNAIAGIQKCLLEVANEKPGVTYPKAFFPLKPVREKVTFRIGVVHNLQSPRPGSKVASQTRAKP